MTLIRSRLLSALLPLAMSLAAASCAEPLTPPAPGQLLFEVEAINFAWGKSWQGFVVDAQGQVFSYDLSNTDLMPPQGDRFSAAELEAKYAHQRRRVGSVSAAEVASRYARVDAALSGSITDPKGFCADAGGVRYTALIYDEDTGTYRRLLLRQVGDVAQANTSAAARDLYHWLGDVTGTGTGGCDPFD